MKEKSGNFMLSHQNALGFFALRQLMHAPLIFLVCLWDEITLGNWEREKGILCIRGLAIFDNA